MIIINELAIFRVVILIDDILTIDQIKIKDVNIEMTIFDGEVIFKK